MTCLFVVFRRRSGDLSWSRVLVAATFTVLFLQSGLAHAQISIGPSITLSEVAEYEALMEEAVFVDGEVVEAEAAESEVSEADSKADEAAQAAEKRKQERLAAIKKLTFDRRPSAILNSWATTSEDDSQSQDAVAGADDSEPDEIDAAAEEVAEAKTEAADAKTEAADAKTEAADAKTEAADAKTEDAALDKAAEAKAGDAEAKSEDAEAKTKEELEQEAAVAKRKRKQEEEKERFEKTTKTLTRTVTQGRWEEFAETLNDRELLSGEEAVAAYNRMLDQLASGTTVDFSQVVGLSEEMRTFMQQMMGNRRNNPAVVYAEKHVIRVPDLTGIIRSAPAEIRDTEDALESLPRATQQKLAGLLRRCLDGGAPIEDFVEAMKPIAGRVLQSQDVAGILSFAGHNLEIAAFLPAIEEAVSARDLTTLNHWARYFLAQSAEEKKESRRVEAWECTLKALAIEQPEGTDETERAARMKTARNEALARAVSLAPKLENDLGKKWLEDSFTESPARGKEVLAKLGTATAQRLAQMPQDGKSRGENLELQHAAVQSLLDAGTDMDDQWIGILNLLAENWLHEAEVTRAHSTRSQYGSSMRRDRYGNLYYADPQVNAVNQAQQMAMRQTNPVKVETVLESAPTGQWFDMIDPPLKHRYTTLMCRLWLKVNEGEMAFPYIEQLAEQDPQTAGELADEFLRVWTRNHNPNQESQRTSSYMFIYGFEQKADKIPLTRSKQERNLRELSGWIERLSQLPLEGELDERLLVDAFMTCHSVAEVYDVEAIEEVFGAWDQIEAGTMARLIDKMRSNLATLWRDPNVQRDNQTKRKKKDIQAEVMRGYEVARSVLTRALERHPDSWQLALSRACIRHDQNEYLRQVSPSSEFTDRRQQAFDDFAAAADAYLAVAADLPEAEQSGEVFDHWFYASLGASDLGGISEQNRLAPQQIPRIKEAMDRLRGETGDRHRQRFANSLFTRMSAVSPSCKFRYLESGFQLVDADNAEAAEARKVFDYYRDLVTELELVTRIDGDARVGHEDPFGVYVDLRHTKELERESGGFAKYLQNQNSGRTYYYNYGRPTENYRDKFEESATTALQDHFEVLSVTFNHPETKSLDSGNGWRVTPYAYLLLKTRGPEVDKLPSLKLDMDFLDTSGYVVLPIDSSPLVVDAGEDKQSGEESFRDLKLVHLLDERQSLDGKLIIETRATARGLVPPLDRLLETSVEGFELVDQEDSGVSVIEFDKESVTPIVLSERTWTLRYAAADPAAPAPSVFSFPAPLVETAELRHQRYVDADLEDVDATVSLVQDYGSDRRQYLFAGLAVLVVLLLVVAAAIAVRSSKRTDEVTAVAEEPPLTPVSLLLRLQSMRGTAELKPERKQQLASDIAVIERHYFAGTNGNSDPDLQSIAARWTASPRGA